MTQEQKINERIGKNIKKYRLLYGINYKELTQKELAEKIGVSTSLIGSLESKKSSGGISVYNLYKISETLKVPIDKFFE